MIYLTVSPAGFNGIKKDGILLKIGYATDLITRMKQYATHNGASKFLEYAETYKKTKHNLEKTLHKELTDRGYIRLYKKVLIWNVKTEWFHLTYEQWQELINNSDTILGNFKACKGRKVCKVEDIDLA